MANDITLSSSSVKALAKTRDVGHYAPDVHEISTLQDMMKFKLEGLGARILRERVYFVVTQLVKEDRWKDLSTAKVTCYDCGTSITVKEILFDDENIECPMCHSDSILIEAVPAFDSFDEFKDWIREELEVTYRNITRRRRYIMLYEELGSTYEHAFNGIVKHGIAWISLTEAIYKHVKQVTMNLDEALNILEHPDKFTDTATVVRFNKLLRNKDDVELVSVPNSPDFILRVVDPEGDTRYTMLYVGIPIEPNPINVKIDNFWNTAFGKLIAGRLKLLSEITYANALDYIPDFDFYALWSSREKVINAARQILDTIFNTHQHVEDFYDEFHKENMTSIGALNYLADLIRKALPAGYEHTIRFDETETLVEKLENES